MCSPIMLISAVAAVLALPGANASHGSGVDDGSGSGSGSGLWTLLPTSSPTPSPTPSPTSSPTSSPTTAFFGVVSQSCQPDVDSSPLEPKVATSDGAIVVQGAEVTLSSPCGSISATVLAGLPTAIDQVRTTTMSAIEVVYSTTGSTIDELNSTMVTSISRAVYQSARRTDSAESRTNATIVALQSQLAVAGSQIAALTRDLGALTTSVSTLGASTSSAVGALETGAGAAASAAVALTRRTTTMEMGLTATRNAAAALTRRTTTLETGLTATRNNFQMPVLGGWRQNTGNGLGSSCAQGQHGMMRRVAGTAWRDRKAIVVCDGTHWNLLPMVGKGANNRLPGGGCVMRDVFSYRTGNGGCGTIDMKTNIRVRSAVMVDISLKGYNYGSSSHVDNHLVFYTYRGWSCTGARSHANYGSGGYISDYCSSDGYVVIRLRPRSSSYYIGFSMDASFLNPTGDSMCGLFEITASRCNGRY